MLVPDLIADWPDLAGLFDTPDLPWRTAVASWPPPWRALWGHKCAGHRDGGMGWREAEEAAYEEMLVLRANPRPLAGRMADGTAARRDPKAMPRMVQKRVTKAVRRAYRDAGGGLFDESEEGGRSTTYQMEDR